MTHEVSEGLRGFAPRVSVLMPVFNGEAFIGRAIESLLVQSFREWELVVIDDGSWDRTAAVVAEFDEGRIQYARLSANEGLGVALNAGLKAAASSLIAYLPADDVYHENHLESLVAQLEASPDAVLAFSGVRHERRVPGKGVLFHGTSRYQIEGYPLQLVQVLHRRTDDRWLERDELVTDDLDRMFWSKLRQHGDFVGTGEITCEWTDHPRQRHKLIREPLGGINPYRSYFRVGRPLRFHSTMGYFIDEVEHYRRYRERPDTPRAPDGLKILLVGELAFNPERVLALEERGHELHGLWTQEGCWFNAVGPLPFGHVKDLPREGWREAVAALQPDLVYALLNWEAVPFAHEVLVAFPEIPFVWHFKESPFDCIANGTWPKLVDLYTRSDGQIFISPEMRSWLELALPSLARTGRSLILDGDLPKREWFNGERRQLLSERDGAPHTVVAGGPVGLTSALIARLAAQDVHLHFYGDFHRGQWPAWVDEVSAAAPAHMHLHPQVTHESWVSELSQYDAGWLHLLPSGNGGDLRRADWGDLNYPARLATYAAAGLPWIQLDNSGAYVASQALAQELDVGLFLDQPDELARVLRDPERMSQVRENMWRARDRFTFDAHADDLVAFFREAVAARRLDSRMGIEATRSRRVGPALAELRPTEAGSLLT